MTSVKIDRYTQPHQFEPLLPQRRLDEFRQRTRALVEQSLRLSGSAHPATVASLRELVREMNSYYSNRIEGQSTHPLNIERALRQDFSDKPDVAKLQRLALAGAQRGHGADLGLHGGAHDPAGHRAREIAIPIRPR